MDDDGGGRRGGRAAWRLLSFLGTLIMTFIGLTAVTFVISRYMAIDPALAIVGDHATLEVYEKARLALGLDRPQDFSMDDVRARTRGDKKSSVLLKHFLSRRGRREMFRRLRLSSKSS